MMSMQRILTLAVISLLSMMALANAGAAHRSVSQVWAFPGTLANPGETHGDFETVRVARSELIRTASALWMTIEASGLPAGVYTVWWVIFNRPTGCYGEGVVPPYTRCRSIAEPAAFDPSDSAHRWRLWVKGSSLLTSPDLRSAKGTVLWATAGIVGPDGVGHFSAHLEQGRKKAPGIILVGKGLTEPLRADVHLIIRWHGAALLQDHQQLVQQLTLPDGGCPPNLSGVECANLYVTSHRGVAEYSVTHGKVVYPSPPSVSERADSKPSASGPP